MKKAHISIILIAISIMFAFAIPEPDGKKEPVKGSNNLLIIGFGDNLNSNYYPKVMIAEKIGIGVNGIDTLINALFLNELSSANSVRFKYIAPARGNDFSKFMDKLKYTGANEELYSDLSSIQLDDYKKLLAKSQSEYMVVFSQYYLKRQEKPFPSVFHIINYTIYNQSKEEIFKGKVYSNSFDLVDRTELEKILQKNAKKNLVAIEKAIR